MEMIRVTLTFDLPTGLSNNAICCRAEVGSSGHKIQSIVVILVKRNRFFACLQTSCKSVCTAAQSALDITSLISGPVPQNK